MLVHPRKVGEVLVLKKFILNMVIMLIGTPNIIKIYYKFKITIKKWSQLHFGKT